MEAVGAENLQCWRAGMLCPNLVISKKLGATSICVVGMLCAVPVDIMCRILYRPGEGCYWQCSNRQQTVSVLCDSGGTHKKGFGPMLMGAYELVHEADPPMGWPAWGVRYVLWPGRIIATTGEGEHGITPSSNNKFCATCEA